MNRRAFIREAGILAGSAWLTGRTVSLIGGPRSPLDRFKLGAVSDGFSREFEVALRIMKSYGLSWVEIRNVWGKYNTEASREEIRHIKEILEKYEFRCSVVDTALYKCTLPGTKPVVTEKDIYSYPGQMDLLKRAIERAHAWGTDKLRGFSFWRVSEPAKIAGRITEELQKAAEVAKGASIRIVIEEEPSCNVGTAHELAKLLKTAPANVGANWDVGSGFWHGEVPYPDGYAAMDKERIWHLHLKGVECAPGFKDCQETFPDQGQLDLTGQLRALLKNGYQETMSLECEFEAPGLGQTETTKRSLEGLLKVMSAALS